MTQSIAEKIYSKLYKKDVDNTINIFLCGADTGKTDSFRNLLNKEFKKYAKFNVVYPEFIFATLLNKKDSNLLELEDELASYVDLIIVPLEGQGTLAEIGAFTVNKKLLPKIIVINDLKYKNSKSFINLGPLDLVKKHNTNHIFYFEKGKEKDILNDIVKEILTKRFNKRYSYELENIFNLSRYLFYIISVYQPLTKIEIIARLNELTNEIKDEKIALKFIDASIQILVQKNRVEKDINFDFKEVYSLSNEGHKYVYEELLPKLQIVNEFSEIRLNILGRKIKKKKRNMDKVFKLLELK